MRLIKNEKQWYWGVVSLIGIFALLMRVIASVDAYPCSGDGGQPIIKNGPLVQDAECTG